MSGGNGDQAAASGVKGAQIGAQVGGGYGAAIGAVIGVVAGYFTPDYEKMAREKYNNEVLASYAKSLFDARKAQNIENMRTAQALAAYQDERTVAQASFNAQYGASDVIGSSARALSQVVDFQTSAAMRQTNLNWEIGIDNYNIGIDSLANSANSGLRRTAGATNTIDTGALVKQGMQLYSQYQQNGGGFTNSSLSGVTSTGNVSSGSSGGSMFSGMGGMFGGGGGGASTTGGASSMGGGGGMDFGWFNGG